MDFEDRIVDVFMGVVVRKDLAFEVKGGMPVPTFVLEYLLGQYCATNDKAMIRSGVEQVKNIVRERYVNRADADLIKGYIREHGRHAIIDKVSVVLNDRSDQYEASFANLGLKKVPISTDIVVSNKKLLSGNGVWSIVTLGYLSGEGVRSRWDIEHLKPIQMSNVDLDDFMSKRSHFSTQEWIDLMIHTVGLNPEVLNRREKFIVLSRLLPFVENNYNFMELGPKGTGKSHVFQEFSPYGVLVSGGDVTPARLFVKISGNKEILGLVGFWDVVAWDEYEHQKGKSVDPVLIDTMQNYLANKSFNRGTATHEASASMCFVGNTKHTVPYMLANSHLFESIPNAFVKGAFLDRIHLYNPGWEVGMLRKNSFSKGFGLITDYISAILHEFRKIDLTAEINKYAKFDESLSERDHLAIRKTFSGMCKLLYPDGKMTDEEAREIVDFAAEGRKRVKDQLPIIDSTFLENPAKFTYIWLPTGEDVRVETLERLECGSMVEEDASEPDNDVKQAQTDGKPVKRPHISSPRAKIVAVRENQSGVTYKSLFGEYLVEAKDILLVDPFIRHGYQIDNLVDFIQTVRELNINDNVKIHLSTSCKDDASASEAIDNFDDIKDGLLPLGIEFSYDFMAYHDRYIKTDTGWIVMLGRGLDIYEKFNRFSLQRASQSVRRCKEFTISVNRVVE